MTAKFLCPHCEQRLSAESEHFGTDMPCPACNGTVHVPEFANVEPPPLPERQTGTPVQPPSLPPKKSPITKRTTLLLAGVGALVLLVLAFLFRGEGRPETTTFRAIDAVTFLPLAPTPEEARNIEFHYNEWNRADYAVGGGTFPTASFRASARILKRQPGVAYIELTDGSKSKGWVPEDWLAGSSSPIARRQSSSAKSAQREADSFLRLTRQQLEARLGKPKQIRQGSGATDGAFDIFVFDSPPGTETFFTIWASDGFVSNGEYHGTPLTPYYK